MKYRSIISLLLAVMLTLTSQAMAVARGASDATGQMVICVGAGTVTVYTDAEGAPTSTPHFCPDCALHLAFLPDASVVAAPCRRQALDLSDMRAALCHPTSKGLVPQTRAPPFIL